jgi:hypothetical protein
MKHAGVSIIKCGYIGSSGPPVVRRVQIPSLSLNIDDKNITRSSSLNSPHEIHEIPHYADFEELDHALSLLEEAKTRYTEAETKFRTSAGGKWVHQLLSPDPELSIRDCISEEEEQKMREELESFGNLKSFKIKKLGYSLICITARYDSEKLLSRNYVENLNILGFKFSLMFGGALCNRQGEYLEFTLQRGSLYPPQVLKDYQALKSEISIPTSNLNTMYLEQKQENEFEDLDCLDQHTL